MARINDHFRKLQAGYLFPEIGRRVTTFSEQHPDAALIKLGIGDVTEPLAPAIVDAMKAAVGEMGERSTFRGYGPEQGYSFLVDKILEHDYRSRGVELEASEIFVSDGSKCDSGNIQEIFSANCTVAVTDPVYPVYVDSNVMAGRTGLSDDAGRYGRLVYLPSTQDNQFRPSPPEQPADLVYICSPNNPTGTCATREYLESWVRWARDNKAVIIFDAAYEAFIRDESLPHSIYEIDGAKDVAIEMRSFSKRAGFTGVRCAFTVVPKGVMGESSNGESYPLHSLWARRHATKFNGTAYVVQRGAEAVYSSEGLEQTQAQVDFYMENARLLRDGLAGAGFEVFGGENAPYIWMKTREGQGSWELFNDLLERAHIVGTPGAGFGPSGEGYFRLSAFNSRENVDSAIERIRRVYS